MNKLLFFLNIVIVSAIIAVVVVNAWNAPNNIPPISTNQAMYISSTGNVGIGTTAPGAKLQVSGDTLITSTLNLGSIGVIGGTRGTLSFGGVNGVTDGFSINNTEGNYLKFRADSGPNPNTAFFIMNNNGNVGIGTTAPSQKLDVAGYVMGQSGLCINNDCRSSWPSSQSLYRITVSNSATFNNGTGDISVSCPSGYTIAGCQGYYDF